MEGFLIAAGLLCLAYYVCLARVSMDFCGIWLLAGGILMGAGVFLWRFAGEGGGGQTAKLLGIAALGGLAVFAAVEARILWEIRRPAPTGLSWLIVLGAQVRGTRPSLALLRRLERAGGYLKENPGTRAVLSGGQGRGEEITEALAMYRWLIDYGIEKDRLVLEDRSASTLENLRFSRVLLEGQTRDVGLVTNYFHIWRSLLLARRLGYENPRGIGAPAEPRYEIHYLVREFFALMKEKIQGNI